MKLLEVACRKAARHCWQAGQVLARPSLGCSSWLPVRAIMASRECTGIGLTTAAKIVERHGGSISADAEPGRGATFDFTLKAGPATTPTRPAPDTP